MVGRLGRLGVCAILLVFHAAPALDAQAQEQELVGTQTSGLPVVQESTAQLMAREPAPTVATAASPDGASTDLSIGSNFTAVTQQEISAFPPDGHIAAGPTQLLVITNGRLLTFAKATGARDNVLNVQVDSFFSSVKAGGDVFGGRVRFDSFSNRWFVTMRTNAAPGRVVIAFSSNAIISSSTVWSFSGFDNTSFTPGTCAIDGPTFGLDASALYFGVSQFCGGTYAGTSAFVVRKASLIAGTLVLTRFDNLTATPTGTGFFSPLAVDSTDGSSAFGYFIGVDNSAFGRLVLRRISNPGSTTAGAVTMSSNILIDVAPTALPVLVPHLGNTGGPNGQLSGGDDRLSSATLRAGRIWTVHAIGVNDAGAAGTSRNGVRWYEIGSVEATPSVLQSGTVYSPTGTSYWNPSIAITGQNRSVIGFSAAGSAEYVNAGVAERLSTDAGNTFGAPALYTSASSAYNPAGDSGSSRGRQWGSYSGTVTDACDDTTVWTLQQFTNAGNSYALQVAKSQQGIGPPVPISATPSAVPYGRASFDITVTGSGAGAFFDSPAGFACRMSASISGVTVNQVTYVSATSVVINVSTVGAVPGAKAVTVLNADLQSATSAGALITVSEASIPTLAIDSPSNQSTVGGSFSVSGWAIDRAATTGTGVDAVHVYAALKNADGSYGSPALLGAASYGSARGDIGTVFGSQFTNSGFALTSSTLGSGTYRIDVYSHSAVVGAFTGSQSVEVTVVGPVSSPLIAIDSPGNGSTFGQSFTVTGWAIDRGALSGTGVAAIHVYSYPVANGVVTGAPQFLGMATYGGARPDLGAVFGAQFTNCAYSLAITVPVGSHRIVAFAYSTVANTFNHALSVDMTVSASAALPMMAVDGPQWNATVSQPFVVSGWAIDRGATSGSGVDAIHVHAFPVAGGPSIFVGVGTQFDRPDIAAMAGAQFLHSGYSHTISGLPPGAYDIYVFARSTVTSSFNQANIVRVNVQ